MFFVWILWDITFFHNTVMPPFFLCVKIFDTGSFLKHRRVPLRMFSAEWGKKFSMDESDISFLCKNFSIPEAFWNTEGFTTKIFGTVGQKVFDGKSRYPPPPPPLISYLSSINLFPCMKNSETQKGPLRFFGPVRQKIFDRTKMPISAKRRNSRYQSFLKHRMVQPRNSPAGQKKSTENNDILFLCIKFSVTRSFLKHWRVPQELFWHCETKNNQRRLMISSSHV